MTGRSAIVRICAIIAIGVGCREVVGIDEHARFEGEPVTCGFTASTEACTKCVRSACCSEAESCNALPSCSSFATCVAACPPGVAACASTCRARPDAGYGIAAFALDSCKARACATECGETCGGYVYPRSADGVDGGAGACAACATAQCCASATTCMVDPECAAIAGCQATCAVDDTGCHAQCEANFPAATPRHRAFGECLKTSCPACVAPHWRCLKNLAPPPNGSTGPDVIVSLRFIDYVNGRAIPDLDVRACGRTDVSCKTPLAGSAVVSDADGGATVHLGKNFFDGYFEISNANYGPVLLYVPSLTKHFSPGIIPLLDHATFDERTRPIASIRPDRGVLGVTPRDCAREPRAGVRISVAPSDETTPFFTKDGVLSSTETATSEEEFATGGFLNVKAETALVVGATVLENGLTFPTRTVQARRAPHALTLVWLYANPP